MTAQQFVHYYEMPKRTEVYWVFAGRIGEHYYMEYYTLIDKSYPEFAGEVRVPIVDMPDHFPAAPQGRPYPADEMVERAAPAADSATAE